LLRELWLHNQTTAYPHIYLLILLLFIYFIFIYLLVIYFLIYYLGVIYYLIIWYLFIFLFYMYLFILYSLINLFLFIYLFIYLYIYIFEHSDNSASLYVVGQVLVLSHVRLDYVTVLQVRLGLRTNLCAHTYHPSTVTIDT
jgi:hypothetical protein